MLRNGAASVTADDQQRCTEDRVVRARRSRFNLGMEQKTLFRGGDTRNEGGGARDSSSPPVFEKETSPRFRRDGIPRISSPRKCNVILAFGRKYDFIREKRIPRAKREARRDARGKMKTNVSSRRVNTRFRMRKLFHQGVTISRAPGDNDIPVVDPRYPLGAVTALLCLTRASAILHNCIRTCIRVYNCIP